MMNMNKDSRRRKRHTPPGPAGILFQTQQAASGKKSRKKSTKQQQQRRRQQQYRDDDDLRNDKSPLEASQVDEEEDLYDSFNNDVEKQLQDHRRRKHHGGFMTMSPSWASMQQDLGLATPYIDQLLESYHNGCASFSQGSNGGDGGCDDDDDDVDGDPYFDSKRRYNLLRPYMPDRFLLLFEIVRGQYDLGFGGDINESNTTGDDGNGDYGTSDNLDDDFIYRSDETALVVLVQSVQSSIHNNIWTVELTDETGSVIRAWIEPSFIQQQLQISAGLGQINANSEPESNNESKSKTARAGNKSISDAAATEAESMVNETTTTTQRKPAENQEKEDNSLPKETQRRATKPTNQYVIRPGVVWLLRKVSIMPAIVSDRGLLTVAGNGRVERMLLISGTSIAKAWIPEDATIDEKKDTSNEQTKYSNWIQKRCDITSRIEDGMDRIQQSKGVTNSNRREHYRDGSDEEDENIEDDIEIQIDNTHRNDCLIRNKNHLIQSRVLNRDLDMEMVAATTDKQISTNHDRRMFNAISTPAPHNHNSNPYTPGGNIVTGSQHKRNFYNSGGNATNSTNLALSMMTTNDEDRTKEGTNVTSSSSCNGRNSTSTTPAGSRSVLSISQSLARFRHVPDQPETQRQPHSQFTASQQGDSQLSVTGRSQDHFHSQQIETQPCPASNNITSQDLSGPEVESTIQTSATTKIRAENFRSPQPPLTQLKDDGRTQGKTMNSVHSPTPKVQSKEQTLVNSTNKEQRKSSEKKRNKQERRKIPFSPKDPIRKQHPTGSKSIWEAAVDDESIDALFDDNDGINDRIHNSLPRKESKEDKGESLRSDQDRIVLLPKGRDSINECEDVVEDKELLTVPEKQSTKKSIFDIPLDDQDVNLDDFDL